MKKVLIGCLGLVVVLILAGVIAVAMLPAEYEVERSSDVSGTPEEVFAVVSDLHTWPEWSFWSQTSDPDCVWTYNDKTGVGARTDWEGPIHGKGYMVVSDVVPGEMIAYDLGFFEGETEMKSQGSLTMTASGDKTTISWKMYGENEGMAKIFGLMIDSMVGPMFEEGLTNLDARLSAGS